MLITIRTSQQSFTTDPEQWLGNSDYFDNLLSGRWGDKQDDNSYFIETDARIFEHILRYLRTGVLPIFFDKTTGHDFVLYQALLEEARYFAIDRLQRWLCERKYLDAVKVHYLATETQDRSSYRKHTTSDPDGHKFMLEDRFVAMPVASNMEVTIVPVTQQKISFYCPHRRHGDGGRDFCGGCADMARNDRTVEYGGWKTEDQLKWCIVRKEVVFDHKLCVEAFQDTASEETSQLVFPITGMSVL